MAAQATGLLQEAISYHRMGYLDRARAACEALLRIQPRNFDALHLLGILAAQSGDPRRAAELLGQAVRINPRHAGGYCNQGSVFRSLGQLDAALASYDRAISLDSRLADAHSNRAVVLNQTGRFEAALASTGKALAIRPDYVEAHLNRGHALKSLGRQEEALAAYSSAISLSPRYAEAYLDRGNLLLNLNRPTEAIDDYDRAIAIKPEYTQAHANRGVALQRVGRTDEALASFDRAIALDPENVDAHYNRANALMRARRYELALAGYDETIRRRPDFYYAYSNRGNTLAELGRFDAALDSYDRALSISPDYAEGYSIRGNTLVQLGRVAEALASYAKSIALKPDYAGARYNKSLALLLSGDYGQGWADYEWRWKSETNTYFRNLRQAFPQRHWIGDENIAGKTILLHTEGGFGDSIQFCRYVPRVADLAARVVLQIQPQLLSLFGSLAGVAQLLPKGELLPEFDCVASLMSLPLAFKTTLADIPGGFPYLRANTDKVAFWREKLSERRRLRVGLVWSGGFRPDQPETWSVNSRRNVELAKMAPLRDLDVDFFSLQKGEPAESELREMLAHGRDALPIHDFTGLISDFSDTAALLENLDLLISVDTAIAHLAGALGKPVWILNRFDTCWRWLETRSDSPWYPTVTLYRQSRPGDWDEVIERVRGDLARYAAQQPNPHRM
jgi:tetratricopeptide (TPR) repeat protein